MIYYMLSLSDAYLSSFYSLSSQSYFRSRSDLAVARESIRGQSSRKQSRRLPPNKKRAIKWCVEGVEKTLKEERENAQPERINTKDDLLLVEALWQLYKARTHRDVIEAGHVIEGLDIICEEKFSHAVQERVMKAAAMTGLMKLSQNLLYSMIGNIQKGPDIPTDIIAGSTYIPSYMAYTAVLNALRKSRKIDEMKRIIEDLASACRRSSENLHVVAFNTYLATLCDNTSSSQIRVPKNARGMLSEPLSMIQPGIADEQYAVKGGPDIFSYNTVLNAAASINDYSIVNEVMDLMKSQGIVADIFTHNARLKALRSMRSDEITIAQRILIIDEVLANTSLRPDAYTIELALVPLAREGRIGDILALLGNFNPVDKRENSVSNAYTTFLIALVKGGEVECARFILDKYILSSPITLTDKTANMDDVKISQRKPIVSPRPATRHFNSVIEGYYRMRKKKSFSRASTSPLEHSTFLFNTMISIKVLPDAYTITMMMGLQNSSMGITNLWKQAMIDLKIDITIPIFNSMMTGYGNLNDPSSACFVFDYMMKKNLLNKSSNSWDALLNSLSKSSLDVCGGKIDCMTSIASSFNQTSDKDVQVGSLPGNKTFSNLVNGLNSIEAAKAIYDVMKSGSTRNIESWIPSPNVQSYCLIASTLSHGLCESKYALDIYNDAIQRGIYPDGRFLNAILRCYGDRVDEAIQVWKTELRPRALAYDKQRKSSAQNRYKENENLIVTYHSLLHVSGRAGRADVALQLTHAMRKDGIEPTETAINCYNAGSRRRTQVGGGSGKNNPMMMEQYENLLAIECMKFDKNDKRRATEKRLRIII